MAAREATGKTVEEAIGNALRSLGCEREEATIEILETASSGFLGLFGGHPAKVRATKKEPKAAEKASAPRKAAAPAKPAAKSEPRKAPKTKEIHTVPVDTVEKSAQNAKSASKASSASNASDATKAEPVNASAAKDAATGDRPWQPPDESGAIVTPYSEQRPYGVTATTPAPVQPFKQQKPRRTREESSHACETSDPVTRQRAETFLKDVFRCMNLDVQMTRSETEEGTVYDLQGEGLGILIGKHGQTLDALQYLANLAANKGQDDGRIHVILDVEGYRSRREETLRRLAEHLAEKACRIHAEVRLEPMNRHERKIIHMALQENRRVSTYSDGDEPYRCVVIAPKKRRRFRPRRERTAETATERIEEE